MNANLIPMVIDQTSMVGQPYDIWSRLLKDRIIFLGSEITEDIANTMIAQLLYLSSDSSNKDIKIYINSPGGDVMSSLAIYDTMQFISNQIETICVGTAASAAAVLLAAGSKGKRKILENSSVMIHQPHGLVAGQVTDMQISMQRFEKMKVKLTEILAKHTEHQFNFIKDRCERDYWFDAPAALEFGLVDSVIKSSK